MIHFFPKRSWGRLRTKLLYKSFAVLLIIVSALSFHSIFLSTDVHHLDHPDFIKGISWRSQTWAFLENIYHYSISQFNFVEDDCFGCLRRDYSIIIKPKDICASHNTFKKPKLLILLFTWIGERSVRDALRNTWLSNTDNKGQVRHVFLVGQTKNSSQQKLLESENEIFLDILQHDYVDNVRNMTLKTISGLRWASQNCPHVQHLMKVDSDVWLNVPKWTSLLYDPTNEKHIKHAMVGHCRYQPPVIRSPWHRYSVSTDIYSDLRHPSFCRGPSYYLPMELVKQIARLSYVKPFIPVEDAFIGHCIKALGYGVYNPPGLIIEDLSEVHNLPSDYCGIFKRYSIHRVSPREMTNLWQKFIFCQAQETKS